MCYIVLKLKICLIIGSCFEGKTDFQVLITADKYAFWKRGFSSRCYSFEEQMLLIK